MNTEDKTVRISEREIMYLKNTGFLPASLARLIESAQLISDDKYVLALPPPIAEQFRSAFTDHIAKAGFDRDYEPTSEGKSLEDLIDRFYAA